MIEQKQQKRRPWARRWWQALFVLLLTAVILIEAVPELRADALYLLTDGISTVEAGGAERVDESKILLLGAERGGKGVLLAAGQKVTIRRGDNEQFATSREDESVGELLQREGVGVGPMEIVRVDTSAEAGVLLEIASDFTYYETVTEAVAFTTVYVPDYTIPKGEAQVTQQGSPGWRDVTYEVVYADGRLVSRQAIAESNNTSVPQVEHTGILVREASAGDTIKNVVRNADGSGYLLMKSGDALHFTDTMDVKCTAYTTGYDGVGTQTYTGTTVHVGVVAVDKSVIPLGSRLFITTANGDYTYGMASAEDTGVRGKSVDLFMETYEECMDFGRRSSIVYFLDE